MSNDRFPRTLRGRIWQWQEVQMIRTLLCEHPPRTRSGLAVEVCRRLGWSQPNGRPKDRACQEVLQVLQAEGWIQLPPSKRPGPRRPRLIPRTPQADPQPPLCCPARQLMPLEMVVASSTQTGSRRLEKLWKELVDRYHFLGYRRMVGPHLKYLVRSPQGWVAALSFGAAAWRLAPRDRWIGWNEDQRIRNLRHVVTNGRFLVMPWLSAKNLASHVLGRVLRQMPRDWQVRYGYSPYLVETFVHPDRHHGTCYRAANWILSGQTQGRGRWDRHTRRSESVKLVFLYPLVPDARDRLRQT